MSTLTKLPTLRPRRAHRDSPACLKRSLRRSLRTSSVAVALVAILAACSLSESEETAADNLGVALAGNEPTDYAEDFAGCLAEKWVGEVGTQTLVDDGVLRKKLTVRRKALKAAQAGRRALSEESARGYAAAYVACVDHDQEALDLAEEYPDASEEDLDEYADCLKDIGDDEWRAGLVAQLTGGWDRGGKAPLDRAIQDCGAANLK